MWKDFSFVIFQEKLFMLWMFCCDCSLSEGTTTTTKRYLVYEMFPFVKLKWNITGQEFGKNIFPFTSFFKKSNATRLWSIISLLSWICIHQIRYPWKACLFALWLMPYLFGLFHWGVCRMSKLGAVAKRKSCKIDRILWEMRAMSCFVLSFCARMHSCARAHSLCRNPPKQNIMLNFK